MFLELHKLTGTIARSAHGLFIKGNRARVLPELIAGEIDANSTVLDIGSGTGEIASHIIALRPDLTIQGVDTLVQNQTKVPVSQFDGNRLPFADQRYDYCLLIDVLHHTTNQEDLLLEAIRVAKKGIIIKDHICNTSLDYIILWFMDLCGNLPYGIKNEFNYLSDREWNKLLSSTKATVTKRQSDIKIYPFPFSLIFNRNMHVIYTISNRSQTP